MKFPQEDIFILMAGMTVTGVGIYLYFLYKNKKSVANLSISNGTLEEEIIGLKKDFYEIGRESKSAMIHINSKKASRQHAFINKRSGKFYLTDNNSRNGTFINHEKIKPNAPYVLTNEDEILIGGVVLKFYDLNSSRI